MRYWLICQRHSYRHEEASFGIQDESALEEVECIIIIKEEAAAKKKLLPAKGPASTKSPAKSKSTSSSTAMEPWDAPAAITSTPLRNCVVRLQCIVHSAEVKYLTVVELAIAEMIFLSRNLTDKIIKMHQGSWDKSAHQSNEIRNNTLGLVGYGNIGSQLSILAEAIGLRVYYYDIDEKLALGNAIKCNSLDELLEKSNIISLHVDGRPENVNMIGEKQFTKMRDKVIFINLSRGNVVDINALKANIESGKIGGTAIDVFPSEPKNNSQPFESVLKGLPNTILTPHIGGSTHEAQVNIAIRWFAGYRLDEKLPDHSSLTKIRQRWGADRFKKIFLKTVQLCIEANLVNGETVHVDATLIRADVSWESLTTEHAESVIQENISDDDQLKPRLLGDFFNRPSAPFNFPWNQAKNATTI